MQTALDVIRGAFAIVSALAAVVLIIYFVVPGMEYSADRAMRRANNQRVTVAMFGGIGLVIGIAGIGAAIAIARS